MKRAALLRPFAFLMLLGLLPLRGGPAEKWETEAAAVEARLSPLPPGGVVFAGSSSIRLWNLEAAFPGLRALNAGFGGSSIAECHHFAPRLIYPWKPDTVVFYAGDNDIAAGLTLDQIAQDFIAFATSLHAALPECRLIFLSIKPSASRWPLWAQAREANARVRSLCESIGSPRLAYVDVASALLGPDGQPRPGLFLDDRLHLNDAGYALWQALLAPVLAEKNPAGRPPPPDGEACSGRRSIMPTTAPLDAAANPLHIPPR